MEALKSSKQPLGAEAIWGLNDWFRDFAPPVLLRPTAAINFSTRLFNLLVTNFPGPQIPFYVLGRELIGVYPVGFLARRHALAIAIFSYNGQVNFGLIADRDSIDDLEAISSYLATIGARSSTQRRPDSLRGSDGDELAGDTRPRFAREREHLGGLRSRGGSAAASSAACARASRRAARRWPRRSRPASSTGSTRKPGSGSRRR